MFASVAYDVCVQNIMFCIIVHWGHPGCGHETLTVHDTVLTKL